MTDHPITLPPKVLQQLRSKAPAEGWFRDAWIAEQAAQWGADQELEACSEWVSKYLPYLGDFPMPEDKLRAARRAARRPKPPSLKEQALDALASLQRLTTDPNIIEPLRRALEALPE